ncbi:hypothetical protein FRC17_005887, partial [Serendipita sp. 399]
MEYIIHFLIEKIEGTRSVKALLPMFPCKQPSDATAFRNAVIKYLETLRTNALKPQPTKASSPAIATSTVRNVKKTTPLASTRAPVPTARPIPSGLKPNVGTNRSVSVSTDPGFSGPQPRSKQVVTARSASVTLPKGTNPSTSAKRTDSPTTSILRDTTVSHGWWWKDSPVRKTLLEECTRPRFERLLLALSIHALVVCHSKLAGVLQDYVEILNGARTASNIDLFHLLVDQPEEYKLLTHRIQSLQLRIAGEEGSLSQRARRVAALQIPGYVESTQDLNLNDLQDSRLFLLEKIELQDATSSTEGLSWLFSLTKSSSKSLESDAPQSSSGKEENPNTNKRRLTAVGLSLLLLFVSDVSKRKTILPPPPLPTAAAQHSSYIDLLKELEPRANGFSVAKPDDTDEGQNGTDHRTQELDLFASIKDQEASLSASLEQFRNEMVQLATLVDQQLQMKDTASIEGYTSGKQELLEGNQAETLGLLPDLWSIGPELDLNFEFPSERKESALSVLSDFRSDMVARIRSSMQLQIEEENGLDSESDKDDDDAVGEEEVDSSTEDEEADKSIVSPLKRSPSKSPQKASKIPLYTHTPKASKEQKSRLLRETTPPRSEVFLPTLITPKPSTSRYKSKKRPSHAGLRTSQRTSMATPSFFFSPSVNMENLKDILPPFQSPWRSVNRSRMFNLSPRKSGRVSIGKPRLSGHRPRLSGVRLGSSSSFIRTPLKSGKRLSNIIAPIQYSPVRRLGNATPRASLDDVYEEIVDDLINESTVKTPPLASSSSSRRLLAFDNSIQRA